MQKPPPLPQIVSQRIQEQIKTAASCALCHKKFGASSRPLELDGQFYCFKCHWDIKLGKKQPATRPLPHHEDHEHCPYCGRVKKINALLCDGCGTQFSQSEILREPQKPPPQPAAPSQTNTNLILPNIQVGIALSTGEQCVFHCTAEYVIDKKGNLLSIFNGDPNNLKHQDNGEFFVTNIRVVFIGKKKKLYIPLEKIIHANVYMTGIELVVNGMKNPIFRLDSNVGVAADRIDKCIRQRI